MKAVTSTSPVQRQRGLFGREQTIEHIDEFLTSASRRGGALTLTGEPGVGKTALLDAVAGGMTAPGARVIRVDGIQRDAKVTYAALDRILSTLHGDMTSLSADYRDALEAALGLASGPRPAPLLVANATLALLQTAAEPRPLLILLDNVSWLDPASSVALAFAGRRLRGTHVALLTTMRTGETGPFSAADFRRYEVKPLNDEAASRLLASQSPELAVAVHDRVLVEAQGNPLALGELPAALSTAQRRASQLLPDVLPLTDALADLYAEQLLDLPSNTRDVLLLSALQTEDDLALLCATVPDVDVLAVLEPAERAGLVAVQQNAHVVFRYPLVRSSVVQLSSAIELRRAHLLLAQKAAAQPHQRAWHLAHAATGPDEHVAQLLEAASASNRASGDTQGALRALARAAELSPGRSEQGRRLVEAAYLAAAVTGNLSDASQLLRAARDIAPASANSLRAATATASLLFNRESDVSSAHRLLKEALLLHGEHHSAEDAALSDALHLLFLVCCYGRSAKLWETFHDALARVAPAAPRLVTLAAKGTGDPAHQPSGLWDDLDAAASTLHEELDPVRIARTAAACTYADKTSDCREALWRLIQDGRDGGAVALSLSAITSVCIDDWLTGHWDEALSLATEGTSLGRVRGYHRFVHVLGGYLRPLILVARGDTDDALTWAQDMADWGASHHIGATKAFAHHVSSLSAIAAGDFSTAYEQASAISPPGVLAPYVPHTLWLLLDLVESSVRIGHLDEARAHVAAMQAANVAAISPRMEMITAACAALASDIGEAGIFYERAVATQGAERTPFELGRIELLYGEYLRRIHDLAGSHTHLLRSLDMFEHLEAQPWARRARAELRAAGLTGTTSLPANVSLTPEELEIATLAAAGLSNKEIAEKVYLSDRTVGTRLYQIFPKLGIASRAALRDAMTASNLPLATNEAPPSTRN
ncbi:AAA family ATPase [Streptomyces sp. NPDC005227]|uniref:helix-turn-helix transcriptional regulator n=1 Tax=Streptomyces sp. NPDC005227 TaxID=3364707 RepID=UPI00368FC007